MVSKLSAPLRGFRAMPLRLFAAGVLSIFYQCLLVLMIVMVADAYRATLSFHQAAVIAFLSTIGFMLPSLAGLGIIEGIYTGLFVFFSQQQETGLTVSLSLRFFAILLALPGVLFFIHQGRIGGEESPRKKP